MKSVASRLVAFLLVPILVWAPIYALLPALVSVSRAVADDGEDPAAGLDLDPYFRLVPRDGSVRFSRTDIALTGVSELLALRCTYSSKSTRGGILGQGWFTNLDVRLDKGAGGVPALIDEQGETITFAPEATGGFLSERDRPLGLVKTATGFLLSREGLASEFDGSSRLARVSVSGAPAISIERDEKGKAVRMKDPFGHFLAFSYDGKGRLVEAADPAGRKATYTYGQNGRLASSTDAAGRTWKYSYGPKLLERVSVEGGPEVRLTHDDEGRVLSIKGPGSPDHAYRYKGTEPNLVVEVIRGGVLMRTHTFAEDGFFESILRRAGGVLHLRYTRRLLPALIRFRFQDKDLVTASFAYDDRGHLVEVRRGEDSVRFSRDSTGRQVAMIDEIGRRHELRYDSGGRLVYFGRVDGALRMEYDREGRLVRLAGPAAALEYRYGADGLLAALRGPYGLEATIERDAAGLVKAFTDFTGERVEYGRDFAGRITLVRTSYGHTLRYGYDRLGNLISKSTGLVAFQYRRDQLGRLVSAVDIEGKGATITRDRRGNISKIVGPRGEVYRILHDDADRMIGFIDPEGSSTRFRFDVLDRLVRVDHPDGKWLGISHDSRSLPVEYLHSDGTKETIRRGPGGRIEEMTGRGVHVVRRHDGFGRLVEVADRVSGKSLRYRYDGLGRKSAVVGPGGEVAYQYDLLGQVLETRLPAGTVTYERDERRRLVGIRYPNGARTRYVWEAGRPTRIHTQDLSGKSILDLGYRYNRFGLLDRRTDAVRKVETAYRYDERVRLGQVRQGDRTRTYAYDESGNRKTRDDGGATISYTADRANRIVAAGEVQYAYDRRGNLIERRGPEGTTRYFHDARNRLVEVSLPGKRTVRYGYAPDGTRSWRSAGGKTERFLHDGDALAASLDEKGNLLSWWAHHPWKDALLAMFRGPRAFYYHTDLQRHVRALTGAGGKLAAAYSYTPFGVRKRRSGSLEQPFGWASRKWDGVAGLNYHRARYFLPELGRFISPDPMGFIDGLNLYGYAGNDPINFTDPDGMFLQALAGGVIGGAIGFIAEDALKGRISASDLLNPAYIGEVLLHAGIDAALSGVAKLIGKFASSIGGKVGKALSKFLDKHAKKGVGSAALAQKVTDAIAKGAKAKLLQGGIDRVLGRNRSILNGLDKHKAFRRLLDKAQQKLGRPLDLNSVADAQLLRDAVKKGLLTGVGGRKDKILKGLGDLVLNNRLKDNLAAMTIEKLLEKVRDSKLLKNALKDLSKPINPEKLVQLLQLDALKEEEARLEGRKGRTGLSELLDRKKARMNELSRSGRRASEILGDSEIVDITRRIAESQRRIADIDEQLAEVRGRIRRTTARVEGKSLND